MLSASAADVCPKRAGHHRFGHSSSQHSLSRLWCQTMTSREAISKFQCSEKVVEVSLGQPASPKKFSFKETKKAEGQKCRSSKIYNSPKHSVASVFEQESRETLLWLTYVSIYALSHNNTVWRNLLWYLCLVSLFYYLPTGGFSFGVSCLLLALHIQLHGSKCGHILCVGVVRGADLCPVQIKDQGTFWATTWPLVSCVIDPAIIAAEAFLPYYPFLSWKNASSPKGLCFSFHFYIQIESGCLWSIYNRDYSKRERKDLVGRATLTLGFSKRWGLQ